MTNHFADAGKPMPDALRLADELDGCAYSIPADKRGWTDDGRPQNTCTDAAAELRRLHDENEALKAAQYECGFGAGCCYQAAKSEADEVLLRQALEALEEYQQKGAPFLSCDRVANAIRQHLEGQP